MTLLEFCYQRRKAKAEATELLDRAVNEMRPLTTPEELRFGTLTTHIHELDTAIAERQSLRKLVS